MTKPGFSVIELMIVIALASLMSLALFQSFYQSNRIVQRADLMMDVDERIIHIQDRLEKDISGAFVPLFAQAKKKKAEFEEREKKEQVEQNNKNESAKKEPKEKRFMPIEKVFFCSLQGKNINELTLITSNPLIGYESTQPRIARVRYLLKQDTKNKRAFSLFRQESPELIYQTFVSTKNPRSYLIADNIKRLSIDFYRPKTSKKNNNKDNEDEGFVKARSWNSDKQAKAKDPRYLIPPYLEITVDLWNNQQTKSHIFELIIPLYSDPDPELPQPEESEQSGPLDLENMPQTRRTLSDYETYRTRQQQNDAPI
ncbi:MAG TPA: prepilin-type N-terminal cleavage/methylation domain-containing protein [Candidatus Babeliales bacterium]|nr:prepilin-type N-terminal cleavage/methylation domain-containing protein [Candidatus Babeliales bacterium]